MDAIYESILEQSRTGSQSVLITVVEKGGSGPQVPGAKMLVRADGSTVGTVGGGELEQVAAAKAQEILIEKSSALIGYSLLDGGRLADTEALKMMCGGTVSLFYEYLGHEAYIYIFGGGHVGRALASHLRGMRCFVTVIDEREGIEAPDADRLIIADYDGALEAEAVHPGGYFLIATPGHEADYCVLARIMRSDWAPRYVGMLGSRKKSEQLVGRLIEEMGDELDRSVLYTPVGLDLGGSTPDEIAISLIAEIQALRYGKAGHRHMRSANSLLE